MDCQIAIERWRVWGAGIAVAYLILEAWLGKTNRTKAGSILELGWIVVIAALALGVGAITRWRAKDGTGSNGS